MGPKKKKKKSKKQIQAEEEEALRLAKLEAEERARMRLARMGEIKKLQEEAKMREKLSINEHSIRIYVLENNLRFFEEIKKKFLDDRIKMRNLDEWERYLRCDRLPFPSDPSSMNTYLYYWSNLKEAEYMDTILQWIEKYIVLLSDLERLMEEPLDASAITIENWKEVRESYRSEIFRKFDQGTFHILRKIQTKMNRIDYWTVDYKQSTKNVKISMWGWLKFPISDLTKRDPPTVDFPDIGITIRLPIPYDRKFVVVRVIYVTFDPLSDSSRTWNQPPQISEGTFVEVVDYWFQKKAEYERQVMLEEFRILEMEKRQLGMDKSLMDKSFMDKSFMDKSFMDKSLMDKSIMDKSRDFGAESKQSVFLQEAIKPPAEDIHISGEKQTQQTDQEIQETVDKQILSLVDGENEEDEQLCLDTESVETVDWVWGLEETFEDFNYDIKEDILDCIFAAEEDPTLHIAPLRKLISERNITYLLYALQSIKVNENYKTKIFNYFKILQSTTNGVTEYFIARDAISPLTNGSRENTVLVNLRKAMTLDTLPNEINLRKYTILGGIYYFDLLNQILQRFPLKDERFIQVQEGKYEIEKDDFLFIYEPPQIVETEEDEEEKPPPDDNIDKLIQVEISLPENILWFEAPSPVLWHKDEKIWSDEHVYDIKFNEEKQRINFRVGRALPVGLSAVRYNNLPYQTWELRPGAIGSNTVLFSLTASTVIMEFVIKGDKVALESLQNATGAALEPILGNFYSIYDLINIMKRSGLDIFPGNDAFLYIEGHSLKDYIVEGLVYMGMAMFSPYFQFSWSRWNMLAGWGKLVYQTRQVYSQKNLPNYSMVMSNLFLTTIVACSEVSPAFSEESIPNIGFNPDLYSLLKNICSPKVKAFIENVDVDLVNTVYNFIEKTKFFSYS